MLPSGEGVKTELSAVPNAQFFKGVLAEDRKGFSIGCLAIVSA